MLRIKRQHEFTLAFARVRVIIVFALATFAFGATASAVDNTPRRPVTVKDLIELAYIVNPTVSTYPELRETLPHGVPLFSPDRQWFLLITQRGNLSTGKLEATLWLFSYQAALDYVSGRASSKPVPKALAVLGAESNMPVISEVRWLPDSHKIAFLGKETPAEQRVYIVNLTTNSVTAVTPVGSYVSQYAIAGDTIAYTAAVNIDTSQTSDGQPVVDVTGKSIYALLFPRHQALEDENEWDFQARPNVLHVIKNGQELPLSFTFEGKPLRIFIPTLSLSPDGERLITVAPVHKLPAEWAGYRPLYDHMDYLNLKPENTYALAEDNPWKAAVYITVNLKTAVVDQLIAAPAGRVLGLGATTTAFWLPDGNHAVLTNSFLPLDSALSEAERKERAQFPALVMVSLPDKSYEQIAYLHQSAFRAPKWYHVDEVTWDSATHDITVTFEGGADNSGVPPPERYRYRSGRWIALSSKKARAVPIDELNLGVTEDLSHAPMLTGTFSGSATKTIWNPNPQLADMRTGEVSLYHWKDKAGNERSGILSLPPDYERGRRYPLVIQTHGYSPKRYFADGEYTTGSGGRALNALGMIVLQMDMPMFNFTTPEDGPFETAGFEAAIDQLSHDGMIDRQRVGAIGFSYSCFHVLYVMTHRPELFAAASINDGNNMSYVQWVMSTDERNALQEISEKTNGGIPFSDHLVSWSHNAPNFALDKARTPLLISSFETGELLAQWETYSGLRQLGKPVDMIWLRKENAPHILIKPRERYIFQQLAVDWFDFWLNGHEDPDPAKRDQYARWRELRRVAKQPSTSGTAKQ